MSVFKCTVCGSDVTRPKSFAFNGGRACRSHPEVSQAASQRQEEQAQKLEQVVNPKPVAKEPSYFSYCRCFSCKSSAIKKEDWSYAMLKSMAKAKVNGEPAENILDSSSPLHQRVRDEFGITESSNIKIVDRFDVSGFSQGKLTALARGCRDTRSVMSMMGQALLCEDCAASFGLKKTPVSAQELAKLVVPAQLVINQLAKEL